MPNELTFDGQWGWVEILGHRQAAGIITTVHLGGVPLLQVDIPQLADPTEFRRQYFGAQSIYCITPGTEEEVRPKHYGQPALDAGETLVVEVEGELTDTWLFSGEAGAVPDETEADASCDYGTPAPGDHPPLVAEDLAAAYSDEPF